MEQNKKENLNSNLEKNNLEAVSEMFKILELEFKDQLITFYDDEKWKAKFFRKLNDIWPAYFVFFSMEFSNKTDLSELGDLNISGEKNSKGNNFNNLPDAYSSYNWKKMNQQQKQNLLVNIKNSKQNEFINELKPFFQREI